MDCPCNKLTRSRKWLHRYSQGEWQRIHQDAQSHDQRKIPGVGRYAAHWPLSCSPELPHHPPPLDVNLKTHNEQNTQQNSHSELEYKHMQGKKKK